MLPGGGPSGGPAGCLVSARGKTAAPPATAERMLRSRPYANEAMKVERLHGGGGIASIAIRRPRYLVPPLSWILPFSSHRRVQLDALGLEVLDLCDGRHTVERMIETFASAHRLTFREAQLPVTQFLRQLTQRGLVAIVGDKKDDDER